jgi:endonuclease/exonuclease/phosphatase family metal-dependent hydrolase
VTTLRLLSYNVRSLRDDAAAVCRVIRAARADVVCVQEAPRLLRWRSKCAALARRSGLVVLTGGRPAAGNLLLCDLAVEAVRAADVLLSPRAGLHQRGMAVAVCRLRGTPFAVAGTHLDLVGSARREHVTELLERLPAAGVPADLPLVVAGDINEEASEPAWSALAARFTDAFASVTAGEPGLTFSTGNPQHRIDGIFVGDGVTVRSCAVLDSPDVRRASDHFPLLAELELA